MTLFMMINEYLSLEFRAAATFRESRHGRIVFGLQDK
jgi:hypothetical protein